MDVASSNKLTFGSSAVVSTVTSPALFVAPNMADFPKVAVSPEVAVSAVEAAGWGEEWWVAEGGGEGGEKAKGRSRSGPVRGWEGLEYVRYTGFEPSPLSSEFGTNKAVKAAFR